MNIQILYLQNEYCDLECIQIGMVTVAYFFHNMLKKQSFSQKFPICIKTGSKNAGVET